MTFEQLPPSEQLKLKQAFLNNPEIKKLDQMASYFQQHRDYIKALETRKEIDKRWDYVKAKHLEEYEKTIDETVKLADLHLPEEILQPLLENVLTLFMCCDIIETAHLNANEILKKKDPNYSMDNFQDLVDLIGNVKRKLKYLQEQTGYMDDLYWGESCDKHYDMLRSKARSILKKKDDINRWGQNLKKYIDGTL